MNIDLFPLDIYTLGMAKRLLLACFYILLLPHTLISVHTGIKNSRQRGWRPEELFEGCVCMSESG